MVEVPEIVRTKALGTGAGAWLDALPRLVAELEREWSIVVGAPFTEGTEAFVAAATNEGQSVVLKIPVPRDDDSVRHEVTVLRITDGDGCARLLRHDSDRGALLLERLGRPLVDLGVPVGRRHEILVTTASRVWRRAPGCGLPTGAEKGRWLQTYIATSWEELDRPCSVAAVDHALACAERRIAAYDEERAVLVHGDVHQWNALQAAAGFKLVDPDGLLAEAEYDLGVMMREDPVELLRGDPHARARLLARLTGLDETAVWEWGVVERVSTGLVCVGVGLQPMGGQMLAAADAIAAAGT